jgi:ribonucleotide monophosphatase NagD (HAD superfamily)
MLCLLVGALPAAQAETLVVNDEVVVADSSVPRPNKGQTMTAVEAKFGAPQTRHAAVGKPPITRWDYMNFVVFFEHDRVIHSVALAP